MPMFNGASIGKVEFDFTEFGIDERGHVPEPSRHLMSDVMDEVQDIFKRVRDEEISTDDMDDVKEALDRVGDDYSRGMDVGEMTDALVVPIAKLCGNVPRYSKRIEDGEEVEFIDSWDESGGRPTFQAIDKLGFRIFLAFMGYVMEQMTSPEASSGESPRASDTNSAPPRRIRRLQKR